MCRLLDHRAEWKRCMLRTLYWSMDHGGPMARTLYHGASNSAIVLDLREWSRIDYGPQSAAHTK